MYRNNFTTKPVTRRLEETRNTCPNQMQLKVLRDSPRNVACPQALSKPASRLGGHICASQLGVNGTKFYRVLSFCCFQFDPVTRSLAFLSVIIFI